MKNIVIVLGSPNSESGDLSDIAKNRLNFCLQLCLNRSMSILCTGGWGKQFNTTELPHAKYAKDYLISKGLKENQFLDYALSSHTVDDAVKAKEVLEEIECGEITIITSDYHLERVKLVFDEILSGYKKNYVGVANYLPKETEHMLIEHEKESVKSIKENGLYY